MLSLVSISGDDSTSEGDSDEDGILAADELESEWMSDSDLGEEGMPVIFVVSLGARCVPQIEVYDGFDPTVVALELPK